MPMLTFGDTYAELQALFTAVFSGNWNTVAQNAASPATNLYVSLHNASPGDSGSQNTSETAYTGYSRVAVARTTGGWTVTQGSVSTPSNVTNAAAINFGACTAGTDTLTHWGIGLSSSGAGTLLAYGTIGPLTWYDFTCTSASPGVLTHYGYTPSVNDRVSVYPNPQAGTLTLPTGLTAGTVYYVGTAPGGQTSTLSTTTANGNPVNTSSTGSGLIYKDSPLAISSGVTPSFAAGALTLYKS